MGESDLGLGGWDLTDLVALIRKQRTVSIGVGIGIGTGIDSRVDPDSEPD